MRDTRGRWLKGAESPNPGGRPAVIAEVKQLAQEYTTSAIHTLADIMTDTSAPTTARIAAANAVLDRAIGRPVQPVESTVEVYDAAKAHVAALMALSERARADKLLKQGADSCPAQV